MEIFGPEHARVTALEFLVLRLATVHCLSSADPMKQVGQLEAAIKTHADLYLDAMGRAANQDEELRAVEISGALTQLSEDLMTHVREAMPH